MRYILCVLFGCFLGIALSIYCYSVARSDDFSPVFFDSGDELPASCVPAEKPLIFFRRTDKQLFVCENGTWEETD